MILAALQAFTFFCVRVAFFLTPFLAGTICLTEVRTPQIWKILRNIGCSVQKFRVRGEVELGIIIVDGHVEHIDLVHGVLRYEHYDDELAPLNDCLYTKNAMNKVYMLNVTINDYYAELDFPTHPKFLNRTADISQDFPYLGSADFREAYRACKKRCQEKSDSDAKESECLQRCEDHYQNELSPRL
jgi:hypothetical protein